MRTKNPRRLTFLYANHRGNDGRRFVTPTRFYFGTALPWYPEPGWLMDGYDDEKRGVRTFALVRMREISVE